MAYERVNYTTTTGKQSAAYWDAQTLEAWDVFTRSPVALLQDPSSHLFAEWSPKSSTETVGTMYVPPLTRRSRERPMPVTVQPFIKLWMIIPTGLFGLACIWMELTFLPK